MDQLASMLRFCNTVVVVIGDVPYAVDLRVVEAAVSRVDGFYAAFF
jgi:hypothetical protein